MWELLNYVSMGKYLYSKSECSSRDRLNWWHAPDICQFMNVLSLEKTLPIEKKKKNQFFHRTNTILVKIWQEKKIPVQKQTYVRNIFLSHRFEVEREV